MIKVKTCLLDMQMTCYNISHMQTELAQFNLQNNISRTFFSPSIYSSVFVIEFVGYPGPLLSAYAIWPFFNVATHVNNI